MWVQSYQEWLQQYAILCPTVIVAILVQLKETLYQPDFNAQEWKYEDLASNRMRWCNTDGTSQKTVLKGLEYFHNPFIRQFYNLRWNT